MRSNPFSSASDHGGRMTNPSDTNNPINQPFGFATVRRPTEPMPEERSTDAPDLTEPPQTPSRPPPAVDMDDPKSVQTEMRRRAEMKEAKRQEAEREKRQAEVSAVNERYAQRMRAMQQKI